MTPNDAKYILVADNTSSSYPFRIYEQSSVMIPENELTFFQKLYGIRTRVMQREYARHNSLESALRHLSELDGKPVVIAFTSKIIDNTFEVP